MKLKRIPFDALTLAAVCGEVEAFVGGKVQGIRQPNDDTVVLELYRQGRVGQLLFSCHADFYRVHFVTKRPSVPNQPPVFCTALRSRLMQSALVGIRMVACDRVLELEFEGHPESEFPGPFRLIAELMGKHSNLILVDEKRKIVSAAKWVGASKSSRPILPNRIYERPPVLGDQGDLTTFDDPAFLGQLIQTPMRAKVDQEFEKWSPGVVYGFGAYPLNVSSLGYEFTPRESISVALEQHYDISVPLQRLEAQRKSLQVELERVLLAREVALEDLRQSLEAGGKAPTWQMYGDLLLAYGCSLPPNALQKEPGGRFVVALPNWEGEEVRIVFDPELDAKQNAQRYFDKAKKAKSRLGTVRDQIERLTLDKEAIEGALYKLEQAKTEAEIEAVANLAEARKWRSLAARQSTVQKEDRPYEGHRIREYLAPGGYTVLVGENAEANDYLLLRVSRPNDYWLHVRGNTSAHVVILTQGKPDKVQKETLEFAAIMAVRNSPMKHSGYVPVDAVLRKYVRKVKGAAKGTAFYTHEKTLHVDGDR